jgi:hypothetical protein
MKKQARFMIGLFAGLALALPAGLLAQPGLGTAFPLYVSNRDSLVKLDSSGNQTHVATIINFQTGLGGVALDASGNAYVATIAYGTVVKVDGSGNTSIFAQGNYLQLPWNLAFDSTGNLYVANLTDTGNGNVVKVDSLGNQSIFATCQGGSADDQIVALGMAFDGSGNLFVTCVDNNGGPGSYILKVDRNGNPSTFLTSSALYSPLTLAFDAAGNLYVEGFASLTSDLTIYKVTSGGAVSPFATGAFLVNCSYGDMAFDSSGNLFVVADIFGFSNVAGQIVKVSPNGTQTVFVTGIDYLGGLAFTRAGGYTFSGFQAPISGPPAVNTGNAGKTYPVKWQLKNASGAYVNAITAVQSITSKSVPCDNISSTSGTVLDASSSGGSGLRYDSTANQYIYNWATPSQPGCYVLTLTLDSGQAFPAYFKLK